MFKTPLRHHFAWLVFCAHFACGGPTSSSPERETSVDASSAADMPRTSSGLPQSEGLIDANSSDEARASSEAPREGSIDVSALSPSRFASWFADYNAGQTTDYLDQTGRVLPRGDRQLPGVAHTYTRNIAYGPFSRNVLDFWRPANASGPVPVIVYIHGGGFVGGDRYQIRRTGYLQQALQQGLAVASIEYRLAHEDTNTAIEQGIPNDEGSDTTTNGARLDYILRDCARAIQYIRYRAADLGIDPDRIGALGSSAGAGCAVWTGSVPDLAVAGHPDPVLRESTRLQAMGHELGQVTYDFMRWPQLLDLDAAWLFGLNSVEDQRLLQMSRADQTGTHLGRSLRAILDYYEHITPNDPPLYTTNPLEDLDEDDLPQGNAFIAKHHVRAHYALYDRCEAQGLECEIETIDRSSNYPGNMVDFMADVLSR